MSIPILITSITLAIIAVVFFGGAISSKKLTTESTFFSMGQTNWLRSIAILMVMFSHYYPVLGLSYSDGIISFCSIFLPVMSNVSVSKPNCKENRYSLTPSCIFSTK